jgi:hypothetical protein
VFCVSLLTILFTYSYLQRIHPFFTYSSASAHLPLRMRVYVTWPRGAGLRTINTRHSRAGAQSASRHRAACRLTGALRPTFLFWRVTRTTPVPGARGPSYPASAGTCFSRNLPPGRHSCSSGGKIPPTPIIRRTETDLQHHTYTFEANERVLLGATQSARHKSFCGRWAPGASEPKLKITVPLGLVQWQKPRAHNSKDGVQFCTPFFEYWARLCPSTDPRTPITTDIILTTFSLSGPAHILCLTVASGWNKERFKLEIEFRILLTENFFMFWTFDYIFHFADTLSVTSFRHFRNISQQSFNTHFFPVPLFGHVVLLSFSY